MSEKKKNTAHSLFIYLSIFLCSFIFVTALFIAGFFYYFSGRILPNVYVAGVQVGGKTREEAKQALSATLTLPEKITIEGKEKSFELALSDIELTYNIDTSVDHAYEQYRYNATIPFFEDFLDQIPSFFQRVDNRADVFVNETKLREFLDITSSSVVKPAVYPEAIVTSGVVTINPGKDGETIDTTVLRDTILKNIAERNFSPILITYTTVNPALTEDEQTAFKEKAQKLVGKSITLSYEFTNFAIKDQKLLSVLDPRDTLFEPKAKELISKEVGPLFNRPAQNAAFKLTDGKVEEFKPAKDGIKVNEELLTEELKVKIQELEQSEEKTLTLSVPVKTESPTVTTQEVNNLGINELIGRGTSTFRGSIASRVFNVGHASGKMNGVLVPPNTVFSFVDTVGDVSKLTGYKEAYIIQNGRTVLGDGGGLCQVSTTLFRAVMNAGLPILERRAHAYRVGYYEQDSSPGLDATVYVPTTDLKFKNDTPNTILIQTIFDPKAMTLVFELYGTKDGRVATVTKPVVTNVIAPPEDEYIDDPTLPTGKVNQLEHKAWGATVTFDYTVTRNGETIYEKKFVSKYQPWKAIYMKGTGPAV